MPIPLHEPLITERDIEVVSEALRSQWVSTGGPYITQFEQKIAQFTKVKHGISVCNGTIGLVLALEVLKRQKNINSKFYALVPTLSFAATWNSVFAAGGIPIPVDCGENEVNISSKMLQNSIHKNFIFEHGQLIHKDTKHPLLCAIPAHILGWASHLEEISTICSDFNINVIEDAAESLGTFYNDGRHVGQHGDFSVLSFNGNKILTTGGGGMILTNNDTLAMHARHLSTTAKTDNLRFVHDEPGFNYRMVNILAALGVSQLARLEDNLKRKSHIADRYKEGLKETNLSIYSQSNCISNNWINTVRFENRKLREDALSKLQANGYDCRPLWTPFHALPYCPKGFDSSQFPNASAMWETMLSLPSSPQLEISEIDNICSLLNESRNQM